ncbi:hypothetical protein [Chryseobacterium salivictor]|uniref:Uncharacterized protein n=1 Tax=Chryseobacterium salivictor TaxID=2547600 RepID=A0A4V1ALF2_9FLAO|nr:hypothetical protein [Chryseobacterium salivictor]QBO59554.1 hypothetical protein NBC122_02753 [Chryseobacterium salivictor]
MARDFFLIQLAEKFDFLIYNNTDFCIVFLKNCFEIETEQNNEQEENQKLKVRECNDLFISYDFDEINAIIIDELKTPILKSRFFTAMSNYLDDDFAVSDLQDFETLIIKRLRYLLDCKILAIFGTDNFKAQY